MRDSNKSSNERRTKVSISTKVGKSVLDKKAKEQMSIKLCATQKIMGLIMKKCHVL